MFHSAATPVRRLFHRSALFLAGRKHAASYKHPFRCYYGCTLGLMYVPKRNNAGGRGPPALSAEMGRRATKPTCNLYIAMTLLTAFLFLRLTSLVQPRLLSIMSE
jgi:hypothetical protein